MHPFAIWVRTCPRGGHKAESQIKANTPLRSLTASQNRPTTCSRSAFKTERHRSAHPSGARIETTVALRWIPQIGNRSAHPSGARIETLYFAFEVSPLVYRSAHPSGARIETASMTWNLEIGGIAPLTRAERGLKRLRGRPCRRARHRSAHPSGARIETRHLTAAEGSGQSSLRSPERSAD